MRQTTFKKKTIAAFKGNLAVMKNYRVRFGRKNLFWHIVGGRYSFTSSEPQFGQTSESSPPSSQSAQRLPNEPRITRSPPQAPQRIVTSPSSNSPQNWHEKGINALLITLLFNRVLTL
jgi:hypothetical protein